jgi:prepilin-type processing-associated H-X9-DG protein
MSHTSRIVSFGGLLLLAAVAIAQPPVKDIPRKGEPTQSVVPSTALGFVSLNVAEFWDHKATMPIRESTGKYEFAWLVQSMVGIAPGDIDRLTIFWKDLNTPFVLVTARKPVNAEKVIESLTRTGGTAPPKAADKRVLVAPGAEFAYLAMVNDRTVLLGTQAAGEKELVKVLDAGHVGEAGPLVSAIEAAGKHTLVVGVNVESIASLPLPVGAPLLEAKSAVLTADIVDDKKAKAELVLTFPSDAKAKAATSILRSKLDELAGYSAAQEKKSYEKADDSGALPGPLLELVATTLKKSKIQANGPRLSATAEIDLSEAVSRLVLAAPDSALTPRGSSPAANNFKQIALAFHNYHDTHGACPSNSYDKDGKPLLSWRVHILPFIEQQALYQQFKLDEPWDSENNKELSKIVIKVYLIPGRPAEPGLTYMQSFIQPKDSKDNFHPFLKEGQSKGRSLVSIPDGTSNTFMVAEAAEAVIWSKPDDLVYEDKKPLPKLGGPNGRFTVAFGDGHVATYRRGQIDEVNMRRLITVDDGQVVNIP